MLACRDQVRKELDAIPDVTGASWLTSSLPVLLTDVAAHTRALSPIILSHKEKQLKLPRVPAKQESHHSHSLFTHTASLPALTALCRGTAASFSNYPYKPT